MRAAAHVVVDVANLNDADGATVALGEASHARLVKVPLQCVYSLSILNDRINLVLSTNLDRMTGII